MPTAATTTLGFLCKLDGFEASIQSCMLALSKATIIMKKKNNNIGCMILFDAACYVVSTFNKYALLLLDKAINIWYVKTVVQH